MRDAKLKVIAESFRDWGRDCWRPRWDFGTSLALEGASPLDRCLADLGAYTDLPVAAVLGKTEACSSATSPASSAASPRW